MSWLFVVACACGETTADAIVWSPDAAPDASSGAFGGTAGDGGAAASSDGPSDAHPVDASGDAADGCTCTVRTCQGHVYECGDCYDNDADGLMDAKDPECQGACDLDEESLADTPVGQPGAACRHDCAFDGNPSFGDDDCRWSHTCDPLAVPPAYPPGGVECEYDPGAPAMGTLSCSDLVTQSSQCLSSCLPRVPNGCDCFGCCQVPGAKSPIWLGDHTVNPPCDGAHLDDPARCRPCTIVASCFNPCEECELCFYKPSLPPSCGTVPQCPAGAEPCGDACGTCPGGKYCVTGCCHPTT